MSNQVIFKEKHLRTNSYNAKELALNLQEGDLIESRVERYTNLINAHVNHLKSIREKIQRLTDEKAESYEITKLELELYYTIDNIDNKKAFFDNWILRKKDYDEKYEMVLKDCNENFDEIEKEAKELAKTDLKLLSYITKYEQDENKNEKTKLEYYLLLKYNVIQLTGKGNFEYKK
jgi:hypothetical protein